MISFIETKLFTRLVQEYLSDDEYRNVQSQLIEDPNAGSVVRGTGGVRKLRIGTQGRGKCGGYRMVYFFVAAREEIWLLTIYPKNVRATIPAHVLREICKEVDDG